VIGTFHPPGCCCHHRNPRISPDELSAIVSDDGIRDPKAENDVLDEIHYLHGANLHQGPCLDPLSKLVDHDKQVGQAPGRLLEGSQEVDAPYGKWPCNGDCLELMGRNVGLPHEVLASPIGCHDLRDIASGPRPIETLLESLSDHASCQSMVSTDPLMSIEE
jgi:hypothetical protein